MTNLLSLVIAALSLCFLVLTAFTGVLIRVVIRYTRSESKLNTVAEDLKELVESKDRIHGELIAQMNRDRDATDRRLRYLEEWHMTHRDR